MRPNNPILTRGQEIISPNTKEKGVYDYGEKIKDKVKVDYQ